MPYLMGESFHCCINNDSLFVSICVLLVINIEMSSSDKNSIRQFDQTGRINVVYCKTCYHFMSV